MEWRRYQCCMAETTALRGALHQRCPSYAKLAAKRVQRAVLSANTRTNALVEAASWDDAHASDVSIRMDEGATDPGPPLGGVDKRANVVVLVRERSSHVARTNGR